MKNAKLKMKRPEGERGFITFDFIFALLMALGFTTVLFALSVTLSAVEVAQYIVFATSRAYVGAHENERMQKELAEQKFAQVMQYPVFKAAFNGGWFTVGPIEVGNFGDDYPENPANDNDIFIGARLPMDAKILRMQIPFLGAMAENDTTGKANLNSYLMREVTNEECREEFNRARYERLKNLGNYKSAPNAQAKLITDNGC